MLQRRFLLLENLRDTQCCYLPVVRRKRQQKYEISSDGLVIASIFIGIDLRILFLKITVGRIIVGVEWSCVNKDTDTWLIKTRIGSLQMETWIIVLWVTFTLTYYLSNSISKRIIALKLSYIWMALLRSLFNFTHAYISPTFTSNFVSSCQTRTDM
jgi:hypothetical protein